MPSFRNTLVTLAVLTGTVDAGLDLRKLATDYYKAIDGLDVSAIAELLSEDSTLTARFRDGTISMDGKESIVNGLTHFVGQASSVNHETFEDYHEHTSKNRVTFTSWTHIQGKANGCTAYMHKVAELTFNDEGKIVSLLEYLDDYQDSFTYIYDADRKVCNQGTAAMTNYDSAIDAFLRSRINLYYATHSNAAIDGAQVTAKYFYADDIVLDLGGDLMYSDALGDFVKGLLSSVTYDTMRIHAENVYTSGLHATYNWRLSAMDPTGTCLIHATCRLFVEYNLAGELVNVREYMTGFMEGMAACADQTKEEL